MCRPVFNNSHPCCYALTLCRRKIKEAIPDITAALTGHDMKYELRLTGK
jgi:hypothetical protein